MNLLAKLTKAKATLYIEHPFFASLLFRMPFVESNGVTTMATDGSSLFFNPDPERRLKEGLAFYPQSTVASAIKRAMKRVDRELDDDNDFMQVMQIHDEIFGRVKEDKVDLYMPKVMEILEEPFTIHEREVMVPADASVGNSWGSMEAWKQAA